MAKSEWKSFDVVSVGKIVGAIYAVMGFLMGLFMAAGMSAASSIPGASSAMFVGFGVASIIIMPIVFGIMGFIGGVICAFIYNIIAGKVGGIVVNT